MILRVSAGWSRKRFGPWRLALFDVSMSMPSLSRSFKSPDVRHSFLYHAAMTATAQASASLNTCSILANSYSESTDTPGRAAGRERTEA